MFEPSRAVRGIFVVFAAWAVFACSAQKGDEEEGEDEAPSAAGVVVTTLPVGQVSPIDDPSKVGTPATFRLLLASTTLAYKSDEVATVLVFDASGQWVNSDRTVTLTLASSSPSDLQTKSEPGRLPATAVVVAEGTPNALFALRGAALGTTTLTMTAEDPAYRALFEFTTALSTPTTVTNDAAPPAANTCAPIKFVFRDASGRDAYFSPTDDTTLTATAAGCALYTDAACTTQTTAVTVPADNFAVEGLFVLSGTGTAFVDFSGGQFTGRANCGAI
jgi:hypothetical protein